ncbi:hypothetical protein GF342_01245 [Candidatus Woesearchaeota archaeon]|nr:hypothetical protein [Candidatus Woesearchaeota archaeon]
MKRLLSELRYCGGSQMYTCVFPRPIRKWARAKFFIRGLFATDGCLYFSKISGVPLYPRLEIKMKNRVVANQVLKILKSRGFRAHIRRCGKDDCVAIYCSGKMELDKWVDQIGFTTRKNRTKYLLWKKLGFYMPRSSLAQRTAFLQRWPSG